jgi:hypothetical protein
MEKEREQVVKKEEEREQAEKKEKEREEAEEMEKEKEQVEEMEKDREQAVEEEREKAREKEQGEGEPVAGRLVGVSLLRHGEGDGVHHRRQQIFPDGGGVPCPSDELVEQGNLLVCGGVCRQKLPEVDFDRLDLGWIVGLYRRVFGRSLILLRGVLGWGSPKSWQAL